MNPWFNQANLDDAELAEYDAMIQEESNILLDIFNRTGVSYPSLDDVPDQVFVTLYGMTPAQASTVRSPRHLEQEEIAGGARALANAEAASYVAIAAAAGAGGVYLYTAGSVAAAGGTLTTVSTNAAAAHISTSGTVATVEIGFVESLHASFIRQIMMVARSQGAKSIIVDTGAIVNTDLAIKLGLASQTGGLIFGGTVRLVQGGAAPIFEILIPSL